MNSCPCKRIFNKGLTGKSNTRRVSFELEEVLFVSSAVKHRFENVSKSFDTWVIFLAPNVGALHRSTAVLSAERRYELAARVMLVLEIDSKSFGKPYGNEPKLLEVIVRIKLTQPLVIGGS